MNVCYDSTLSNTAVYNLRASEKYGPLHVSLPVILNAEYHMLIPTPLMVLTVTLVLPSRCLSWCTIMPGRTSGGTPGDPRRLK